MHGHMNVIFIIHDVKFITMHGHMNVKFTNKFTFCVKSQLPEN